MFEQVAVALVLVAVFAGIALEKIDKTIIALAAAVLLVVTRLISFEQAIHAIDFNTIGLLLGMMLLVACLYEVRLFEWISLKLGLATGGNPVLIFAVFSVATAVISAFLDNVTTVLIIIPLAIALVRGIGLDPKSFVLCIIFQSNIGGTATLIGDPPNIMIGAKTGLTFLQFVQYLTLPCALCVVVAMLLIRRRYANVIRSRARVFGWLFMSNLLLEQIRRQEQKLNIPRAVLVKSCVIFGIVLLGFFTHAATGLNPAVVAIGGAVLMLLAFPRELELHHGLRRVEWGTLLFFAGLFIVVGAVEQAGLLKLLAHGLVSLTDNLWVLLLIVLWTSAILSAVIDNIPFVAVMIPTIQNLITEGPFAQHPKAQLLWWALSLGACLGGNGTQIGASANVIGSAIARSAGVNISFGTFAREALPTTFATIVVSALYLTVLYVW